jgi:hypothetical protein
MVLDETPLEPRFVVWRCDHCRNGIEFDAVQLAGRKACYTQCPHCGRETSLQEPPPPPPLVPDEGWTLPAPAEAQGVAAPAESAATVEEPPVSPEIRQPAQSMTADVAPPPPPPVQSELSPEIAEPAEEIIPDAQRTGRMPVPLDPPPVEETLPVVKHTGGTPVPLEVLPVQEIFPPTHPSAPSLESEPVQTSPVAASPRPAEPKPITVTLPPDPPPPALTRGPMDVRWLTDLGVVYFRQHQFGEAFQCFRRAAQQGFASAQFCLAVCYFNGKGTPQDEAAALPWLGQAAAQGDANAEFTLGLAYRLGRGVAPDASLATQWLQQAAAHGHAEAIRRVREMNHETNLQNQPPAPPAPSAIPAAPAPEKNPAKPGQDLQRLIHGLFGKK